MREGPSVGSAKWSPILLTATFEVVTGTTVETYHTAAPAEPLGCIAIFLPLSERNVRIFMNFHEKTMFAIQG